MWQNLSVMFVVCHLINCLEIWIDTWGTSTAFQLNDHDKCSKWMTIYLPFIAENILVIYDRRLKPSSHDHWHLTINGCYCSEPQSPYLFVGWYVLLFVWRQYNIESITFKWSIEEIGVQKYFSLFSLVHCDSELVSRPNTTFDLWSNDSGLNLLWISGFSRTKKIDWIWKFG